MNAEIISADSRQVYRALSIGTAKPTQDELARVPHHFIDELDLSEPFSAGRFAELAERRIDDILGRGRNAIVVGGATLYAEALMHGLADIPDTSSATRAQLMERLRVEGSEALFDELAEIDAATAATMDPTKSQRVVRALEVYLDTGRPLSYYLEHRTQPRHAFVPVVLTRDRKELYERINKRVDHMISAGLIDENEALLEKGFKPDLNPLRTIGYREPMSYLTGDIDLETMIARLKQNSRRYAKRQLTWFRRRPEYHWINLSEVSAEEALDQIVDLQ